MPTELLYKVKIKTLAGNLTQEPTLNAGDTLLDVKHFLSETLETCYFTHYLLKHDGADVNDFVEINTLVTPEQEEAAQQSKGTKEVEVSLQMVEACYEERSVRAHVKKLRDVLAQPKVTPGSAVYQLLPTLNSDGQLVLSALDQEAGDRLTNGENEDGGPLETSSLKDLLAYDFGIDLSFKESRCLKSISLSALNPVPGYRKVQGDIAYYDVVLADDRRICVTASVRGFFVNRTIYGEPLNPLHHETYSQTSYTLVGLLCLVSSAFKRNWTKLISSRQSRDPFESWSSQSSCISWVSTKSECSPDPSRLEDSLVSVYGLEVGASARDWNEEYQGGKEMPKTIKHEYFLRDRTLFKTTSDFLDAATRGAMAVVENCVPSMNPMDPISEQMYQYNNIFFSYATMSKDKSPDTYLSEQATYTSTNQDLIGIAQINTLETEGLFTLATALIDYRGSRVVAQVIVPGILQGDQINSVLHGYVENGKKFIWTEESHQSLMQIARKMHMKESKIVDVTGTEYKVCFPAECKMISGADGRKYLLDLFRTMPSDLNVTDERAESAFLRPELIRSYSISKVIASVSQAAENEKEQASNENLQSDEQIKNHVAKVAFNVNFTRNPKDESEESWRLVSDDIEADKAELVEAGKYLMETVLPSLINQFKFLDPSPVEGKHLKETLHSHGVNMRYLGTLHQMAADIPYVQVLCEREIIARCCKYILRSGLLRTGTSHVAFVCAHFLNCLLGRAGGGKVMDGNDKKNKKKKQTRNMGASELDTKGPLSEYGSTSLWESLQQESKSRFSFNLDEDRMKILDRVGRLPLLRAVCQRFGVQVQAREYDFKVPQPFTQDDILQLFPVTKGVSHECKDAQELLSAGKKLQRIGNLHRALEVLHEALYVLHQTCGPIHTSIASCYSTLALVHQQVSDFANALSYQQKAIAIWEIVCGWDDHEVALGYSNLALYSYNVKQYRRALQYMKRAEYLLQLQCGQNHPDVAGMYINTAMIHLDLNHVKTALRYLHKALKINETMLGEQHLATANSFHATAVALVRMQAFPLAVKNENKNYEILKAYYGESDPRVVESARLVVEYTAKAKLQAQNKATAEDSNRIAAERLRAVIFSQGGVQADKDPSKESAESSAVGQKFKNPSKLGRNKRETENGVRTVEVS
uniref:Clu domain-containing protein n=1 Tax=Hanusia phi TaxID=3032 RepID=A0A6T7ST89_9CRYP